MLFSSISAAFGNPGQADYATGNALPWMALPLGAMKGRVMDKGGDTRCRLTGRSGKLAAWPSANRKALMRQSMGAVPLPSAEGLAAFAEALALGASQAMVLYGDPEKIRTFALRRFEPQTAARAEVPEAISQPLPRPALWTVLAPYSDCWRMRSLLPFSFRPTSWNWMWNSANTASIHRG